MLFCDVPPEPISNLNNNLISSDINRQLQLNTDIWYPQNSNKKNISGLDNWSIFSNNLTYPKNPSKSLAVRCHPPGKNGKALNAKHLPPNSPVDINCCSITEDYYLDKYDPVSFNVASSHDDSVDISTTYLGKINAQQADTFQAEGSIPIFCNSHTTGRILTNQIEAKSLPSDVLFDSGASKNYMSKPFTSEQRHSPPAQIFQHCQKYSSRKWSFSEHPVCNSNNYKHE